MLNETIRFKNPTEHTLRLEALGLDSVDPGGEIDVPIALAAPGRTDSGNRAKSALECACPQLVAVSEADRKALAATPVAPTPVSKIVSIAPRQAQEPAGVKALREKREAMAKAETDTKKPPAAQGATVTK